MQHTPSTGAPGNEEPIVTRKRDEELPEAREVAPGIWKIVLPIPFPLRTVNVYALVGPDGWALIDAGMGTPEARAAFQQGLERIGLRVADLRSLVLTHHHPDHIGLSGELQEESGSAVYMHPIDEAVLQVNWSGTLPERFNRVSDFFARHGLTHTELWFMKADPKAMRMVIRTPAHDAITPIEDGQVLELAGELYKVIWVPGHSDGQICLFREREIGRAHV